MPISESQVNSHKLKKRKYRCKYIIILFWASTLEDTVHVELDSTVRFVNIFKLDSGTREYLTDLKHIWSDFSGQAVDWSVCYSWSVSWLGLQRYTGAPVNRDIFCHDTNIDI